LWLATGVLAALRQREQTGIGLHVSTSLLEVGATFLAYHLASWQINGEVPGPEGSEHPAFAPYGIFRARDGHLAIGIGADHLFVRLANALDAPHLLEDRRYSTNLLRVENREALREDLEAILHAQNAADWERRLVEFDVPASRVANVPDVLEDKQLGANEAWLEIQAEPGADRPALRLPGIPIRLNSKRPPLRTPPPLLQAPSEMDGVPTHSRDQP
jgi:crotonobetainyl-CoA:carnitine CoA-transferase CaiB-like acyl-CoA transferase